MEGADLVIGYFGGMSAAQLITLTHSEAPWKDAYQEGRNNVITDEAIKAYYSKTMSLK
jgi:uncharacterized phage-associated protein